MDVHDRLAQNLRRLRQVRNWSQEELAHQTDIHRTYVSDLERARRNPSIEVIERLAKGLNVKLGELLD
ncbi:MAG: helix-turn-helix transcriptional regulator [Pseudomonadota bacterium]